MMLVQFRPGYARLVHVRTGFARLGQVITCLHS
jgi:hypothetical protein